MRPKLCYKLFSSDDSSQKRLKVLCDVDKTAVH